MGAVDALCVSCGRAIRWDGGLRKCTACKITHVPATTAAVMEVERMLRETKGDHSG